MTSYDKVKKYIDHKYTHDDVLILDSSLVKITAKDLRILIEEIDSHRAKS